MDLYFVDMLSLVLSKNVSVLPELTMAGHSAVFHSTFFYFLLLC